MTTTNLGIGIRRESVSAVLVSRDRVRWSDEEVIVDDGVADALHRLLKRVPRSRLQRTSVTAAVGPHQAQLKRILGLPPGLDQTTLGSALGTAPERYFLRNGVPLCVTGAVGDQAGIAWGAAIERPILDALTAETEGRRWRFFGALPLGAALRHAFGPGVLEWTDGGLRLSVRLGTESRLEDCRRTHDPNAVDSPPRLGGAGSGGRVLATDAEGTHHVDALAAVLVPSDDPLLIRTSAVDGAPHGSKRRLVAATIACLLGVSVLVMRPLIAERSALALRSAMPAEEVGVVADARNARSHLQWVSDVLAEIEAFAGERRSVTEMLGQLADLLPAGSEVRSLSFEEAVLTLVLATPDRAGAIEGLGAMTDVLTIEVVGPVVRDARVEGIELERLSLRLTFGTDGT